jgi:amidase
MSDAASDPSPLDPAPPDPSALDPHPASATLGYLSSGEVLDALATGELTSEHLVEVLTARAAAIDDAASSTALRAFAALAPDALALARHRDDERRAGRLRGALHGVPVVVKDNIEATGLPATAGSTALRGRPARDAELVTRLRDAGAIVLASTNLSQWANFRSVRSTSGYSATGGLVANPWALDRSAGGSSSGSGAALAAGLAPLAVGTETDGSIVCPASLNGVVGLKPTVGVVPATRVVPISASQDSPGPMGRRVEDVARLFAVLGAREAPRTASPRTYVVAANWRTEHPATDALFDDLVVALRESGADVRERDLAVPGEQEESDELTVLRCEIADDLTAYLRERPGEGVASLAEVVDYEDREAALEQRYFGHDHFLAALASGGRAGEAYAPARRRNLEWAIATCLEPALEDAQVVLAPAYGPAWKSDLVVGGHPGPASVATMAPAIAGWPVASVPLGLVHGLPVGVAVLGRAHDEWTVLAAARVLEALIGPLARPTWRPPERG